MAIKHVVVLVEDKTVTIDNVPFVIDPWDFGDSDTWAIQWNEETKKGDIESNPPGDNVVLGASDYDAKVKPYVDKWNTAKAALDATLAKEEEAFQKEQAELTVARREAEAANKTPRQHLLQYKT